MPASSCTKWLSLSVCLVVVAARARAPDATPAPAGHQCAEFDGNCTGCWAANESIPGNSWDSPCQYIYPGAQGHTCQPLKWWTEYKHLYPGSKLTNCTRPFNCTEVGSDRAACWAGHWDTPPTRVPSSSMTDGPLLGDGEAGVTFGSDGSNLTAFVSANSFWTLR